MSYWKQPQQLSVPRKDGSGRTFNVLDWNKMLTFKTYISNYDLEKHKEAANQIAKLMESIGININTSYGTTGSSASDETAIKYLQSLGYITGSKLEYTKDRILNSLYNKCPVFIVGYKTEKKVIGVPIKHEGGHAWLIDGYALKTRRSNLPRNTSLINDYYFHVNWGWNSDLNGYYADGVFDTGSMYQLYNNDLVKQSVNKNEQVAFKYKIRIYTNIKWGK